MKIYKRIAGMLLVIMIVLSSFPVCAFAAGSIDLNRDCTLTISYRDGSMPLNGAKFSIYRAASVNENGELTVTEDFKQFNVNIRGKDDAAWKALASTLEGYVLKAGLKPVDSGTTDKNGTLTFPTEGKTLRPGLYLILGTRYQKDKTFYDAQPSIVLLPLLDQEHNEWDYNMTANLKYVSTPVPEPGATVTRKVLKVWKDNGHKEERPEEIVVDLLQNGEVYDTVTLDASNNWRYTWEDLEKKYKWSVVEETPEGYDVKITRAGITFMVTNTYTVDIPDQSTPQGTPPMGLIPTDPITGVPYVPETDLPDMDVPLAGIDIQDNPTPKSATLPQTGQLWWPVPILLCAGLLCIVTGLIRQRGVSDEK